MPIRRIVHSPSFASLAAEIADFLRARTPPSETVLLAPSAGAAEDLVRAHFPRGILGVHRLTLTGMALDLASLRMAEAGLTPMSRLATEALIARQVHRLLSDGGFEYFSPVAARPGFVRSLARTIEELRVFSVSGAALERIGARGRDLARILALYTSEMQDRSLGDTASIYQFAIEAAISDSHPLLDRALVLMSVPVPDTARSKLLAKITARAPAVLGACLSGDTRGLAKNHSLTVAALLPLYTSETEPRPSGSGSPTTDTTLSKVRSNLFHPMPPVAEPPDDSLLWFSAATETAECVEIARRILQLGARGTKFDRIAILVRNPQRYQPLIEEALRRARIQSWFSQGVARPDTGGRALLALLECAAEACSVSRFTEYLSLDQVARHVSHANWETLLVDSAVIGGTERWERRLKGLRQQFALRLDNTAEEAESEREWLNRRIAQIDELSEFALPLVAELSSLPKAAQWSVWLDRLAALAQRYIFDPQSVLALLDELSAMGEAGPVSLDEVTGVLSPRLRFLQQEPAGRRYGRVFVGSMEEGAGYTFEWVFVPGLAEGLFPRRPAEDPILLDEDRARVEANLPLQGDRVAAERLLLLTATAAAERTLVFSYPRRDAAQARARVPSFYALELAQAALGRLPDLREFEAGAAASAPSRLHWPAPMDSRLAIDHAEYDLAYLAEVLDLPPSQRKGRAAYLQSESPVLYRSMRARFQRWGKPWTSADGLKASAGALSLLQKCSLKQRSYSPTALQHFAVCPYRFLLRSILHLHPREEAAAFHELDPLTRGAMFHRIQQELFTWLAAEKPEDPEQILAEADRIHSAVAAQFAEDLAPAIPRVWNAEMERMRIDLRGWVERSVVRPDGDWVPHRFEHRIDTQLASGYQVRGFIDLVERKTSTGQLRVVDHKTGKPPEQRPVHVGRGEVLQPVLYGMAAEAALGAVVTTGRLSYCTERGNYSRIDIALSPESRESLTEVLEIVDVHIAKGFLQPYPKAEACGRCDYLTVCGPREPARTSRKETAPLKHLIQLRSLP